MKNKLVVVTTLVLGIAFLLVQNIYAEEVLSADEARDILKSLVPDIEIIEVRVAPAEGLWEIAFKSGGRKGIVYLDSLKENIFVGQLISLKTQQNLTRERIDDLNKVNFSDIPLEGTLVMGNQNAPNKVIVFDDPD